MTRNYHCEECGNPIVSMRSDNLVETDEGKKVMCKDCISKQNLYNFTPSDLSNDSSAFGDIFQMEQFKNIKKDLEKKLKERETNHPFNTQENYSSSMKYQSKTQDTDEEGASTIEKTVEERPSLDEVLKKLDALVGLSTIKKSVRELLQSFEGQKRLYEQTQGKIKMEKPTLHMAFTGNDGTGKREVAKVLTELLFAAGHINENKYIETDRSGLVAEHVGATSPKVLKKVKEAVGGVLFIHEANSLLSSNGQDFGREAIATLSKEMEKNRDNLVVILGGVESEMLQLLQQYPALSSRIPFRFSFQDYTPKQLALIAKKMLEERGYDFSQVLEPVEKAINHSSKNGAIEGNGHWVHNFVQKIAQQHVIRFTKEQLETNVETLVEEDIRNAVGVKTMDEQEGLEAVKEAALANLNELIGLKDLKTEVTRIMNFFSITKRKFEKGITSTKPTMHMTFIGPPGTGKTTVAKIMAQFLKGEGILSNGHLKEVSRADLVGAHVGETAIKVKKVVQESIGGILFIDEAYSLDAGPQDSYGQEAIDTLIKEMEENRDNLIVILAGYEDDMERLLEKNAGFKSRVAYQFDFPNYNVDEMMEIIKLSFGKQQLEADDETNAFLHEQVRELADSNEGVIDGNGRWVRNFMDKLQISQSNRIMTSGTDDLVTIVKEDISETLEYMSKM